MKNFFLSFIICLCCCSCTVQPQQPAQCADEVAVIVPSEEVLLDQVVTDEEAAHSLEVSIVGDVIIDVFGTVEKFNECLNEVVPNCESLRFDCYTIDWDNSQECWDFVDLYDARGYQVHLSEVMSSLLDR